MPLRGMMLSLDGVIGQWGTNLAAFVFCFRVHFEMNTANVFGFFLACLDVAMILKPLCLKPFSHTSSRDGNDCGWVGQSTMLFHTEGIRCTAGNFCIEIDGYESDSADL